jgi:hypothetical protein
MKSRTNVQEIPFRMSIIIILFTNIIIPAIPKVSSVEPKFSMGQSQGFHKVDIECNNCLKK